MFLESIFLQDNLSVFASLFFLYFPSALQQGITDAISYDENHPDFPMTGEHMEKFAKRWLLHSLMWSFCGSASWDIRKKFSDLLLSTSGVMLPVDGGGDEYSLYDYRVRVEDGEYELWSESVPRMEIESHRVPQTDVVITTTDTVRHSDVLGAWLGRRTPLVLCGPPGKNKEIHTDVNDADQSIQQTILTKLLTNLLSFFDYSRERKNNDADECFTIHPRCCAGESELFFENNT